MEAALVKVKITEDMIGKPAFIAMQEEAYNAAEWSEPIAVKFIPGADYRSIKQNNLYFACLGLMVENKSDEYIVVHVEGAEDVRDYIWSTKDKAHSQVRWACKYIDTDSIIHVPAKNGSRLYFQLDSVSFAKSKQKKVNKYYDDAFQYMADSLGITVQELIEEAEKRMKSRRACALCGNRSTDKHHLFSQTKQNRELYGKLLDDERNIMYLCNDCHLNKSVPKWNELEFCEAIGIEVRSKSGRGAA